MKIQITKLIGKSTLTIEVEEPKAVDALASAAFYANTPDKCSVCNGTEVVLDTNKAEGFTFVKIRCLNTDCRATANLGQYKDGSGLFWRKFEKYEGNAKASTTPVEEPKKEGEDLPF